MLTIDEKIRHLSEFRSRDKFSTEAWNERGLHPSDEEMCEELKIRFNRTASDLIAAIEENASQRRLKSILKKSLSNFRKFHYDTEEKEFIVDLFYILSRIVEVDIRNILNIWMYGIVLTALIKATKFFKPEKIIERIKYSCTQCNNSIEVQTLKRGNNTFKESWEIGRCGNCGEYNIVSSNSFTKRTRYINFFPEEFLDKSEFTYEQALTRLEQVKFFRK